MFKIEMMRYWHKLRKHVKMEYRISKRKIMGIGLKLRKL
jgi:hypothetical protein